MTGKSCFSHKHGQHLLLHPRLRLSIPKSRSFRRSRPPHPSKTCLMNSDNVSAGDSRLESRGIEAEIPAIVVASGTVQVLEKWRAHLLLVNEDRHGEVLLADKAAPTNLLLLVSPSAGRGCSRVDGLRTYGKSQMELRTCYSPFDRPGKSMAAARWEKSRPEACDERGSRADGLFVRWLLWRTSGYSCG
ncbi:cytochrome P450 [Striga asiatica]|uniref:Cytochrome P450 n=1 Tax=Striga asiatica TaxID=4170 RepID=A0A5A7Q976_STRAF|nr:cytochrome P450 [Striga asiatica]